MRKTLFRAATFLTLFFCCLLYSLSQKQTVDYASLLQQFRNADDYYKKATNLSFVKNYGEKEEKLENEWNQTALNKFSNLFKQIPANNSAFDSLRFFTAFRIGELHHYFEDFTKAIASYKEAINTGQKNTLADSVLFKPLLYAGIIYYNQNKFDTAVQYFNRAEKIQESYRNKLEEGERLYNILGVLYYERGNYKQAQNYFQKAMAILPPTHPYYKELFVNYSINLAQLHMRLENYDEANSLYQKLLPLNINKNEIYHNLGSLNLLLGAAQKALTYLRKVSYSNNKIIRLYNSMGNAFFELEQFDSAWHYYQKAVAAYQSLGSNSDPVGYGLTLKSLGDYKAHFDEGNSALLYYQKALHQFYPSFPPTDVKTNPENFSGVFSYINLFNTLTAKAETWHRIYEKQNNLAAAQQEVNVYQSAFQLVEYVERTYESDEARLFLGKIKYAIHSKPIDVAYQLYAKTKDKKYLEALYFFDQQNKATTLALSRQISNELAATHSPLLKKEQDIKSNITRYSIRAAQVTDSAQLASLNQTIRDYEIELSKVQEQLNQQSILKESNVPPLSWLQKTLLDETTALISYHLSENKITTLLVTQKDVRCFQRNLPANFYDAIDSFITALKNPSTRLTDTRRMDYYALLFDSLPLQKIKQVIIIPDDVLNYLPFECLQNHDGRYFIEQVAVQYQYSTALLKKEETNFAGAPVLSFAPFAHASLSDTLSQLINSKQEIEALKGKQFFDAAATKNNFLQNCSAYKIVHLATHAVVNNMAENLSYIAFAQSQPDYLLYEQEIYNLPLRNTDLVILSACETSAGQLVKGEGVMSLSRAFTYAGCSNIITTLWRANDFSTAYLTTHIHRYLDKNYSIAQAVQQAKMDYLNDKTIHPRLKQPYYWSHLIFIGNFNPEPKMQWGWFVAAGVVAIIILFLLLKRHITEK